MKTNEQRINNIIGQLEGIKRMYKENRKDCFSILNQLKAVRSALSSLMDVVVSEEVDCLLADKPSTDRDRLEKIFNEVIKNN